VMRKNEDKYKQVENPEKVADIVGISSVMVQDQSGKRYALLPVFTFTLVCSLTSCTGSTTTSSTWRP